jgi:hypothetical protein
LESIIEQYRLTNDRLKAQLLDIQDNHSKSDVLVEAIKSFFVDVKTKSVGDQALEQREESSVELIHLASKITEAIDGKESNYLKESLKEFANLLSHYKQRNSQLEKEVIALTKALENSKKTQEFLEYEMKEVLKAAQEISNPNTEKPVNVYQLKMELRNRLKTIDRNPEVTFLDAAAL